MCTCKHGASVHPWVQSLLPFVKMCSPLRQAFAEAARYVQVPGDLKILTATAWLHPLRLHHGWKYCRVPRVISLACEGMMLQHVTARDWPLWQVDASNMYMNAVQKPMKGFT